MLSSFGRHFNCSSQKQQDLKGRLTLLRKTISLLFLLLILESAAIAQSETSQASAAKSIQPAQTPAAIDLAPKTDSPVGVSITFQPAPARELKLTAGTQIDIEAAYTVSSIDLKPGDLLTFRVL